MKTTPFYDPRKTYDENLKKGPFGDFANGEIFENKGEPKFDFLGHKVYLPFGIPAGPLPNYKFCKAAFEKGFDLVMYKTVRTKSHPCNKYPNVVPVKTKRKLTLKAAAKGLVMKEGFTDPLAITNSFGVPSQDPDEWQPDMKKAVEAAGKGQVFLASYQATKRGEGEKAFLADWVLGAKLVKETGAPIIELNLSCPNEGEKTLLCHDTDMIVKITKAVRKEVGGTALLLKMSYFTSDEKLRDFIDKLSPIVDGFEAINTISSKILKPDGSQALPGKNRTHSGVCGTPIKWAGLEMVHRMNKIREISKKDFTIIGTGGVTSAKDYKKYTKAGADAVMSATGAMWNANLAREIQEEVL